MKRFSIVFLMAMFLANAFIVSAWAKPCMMDETEMTNMSSTSDRGDMLPCHEEKESEKKDSLSHCDGLCLCLHVSTAQTPLLSNFVAMPDVFLGADTYNVFNEIALSWDYSPSHPPPIFTS